ncbi:MAG TPA: ATP-binding cassette domain-containing protein, partial [Alphaproteobacteria bacterium]|nr:ATP-binding cassette domain-containing protein [Alphaproteobacteria bacterium]
VPMREHLALPRRLMDELTGLKLAMVGLPPETCTKYPSELSGGMRKRAGLARSLALDPELLFLDEPTAGLDPIGAAAFDSLIRRLQRSLGLTVFMVTHDLDSLHAICDRIAVLAEKRIIVIGTMDDMLRHPHPWVREYFHGPRGRAALAAEPAPGQA